MQHSLEDQYHTKKQISFNKRQVNKPIPLCYYMSEPNFEVEEETRAILDRFGYTKNAWSYQHRDIIQDLGIKISHENVYYITHHI